ncbi:hypothetical protein CSPAE12_01726 [Colletotrichum incanum]|nr:hypothetical protein CSPAE12_01726 [Colletotrichum incanum]
MRFAFLTTIAALYISSVAAETFLQIGHACDSIGDPNWVSNCNAADSESCINMCDGRCQSGDSGRWMATPNGDCDCYCN